MTRYPIALNPTIIHIVTTSDLSYDQRLQRIEESLVQAGFVVKTLSRNKMDRFENKINGIRIKTWFRRSFLFYLEYNLRLSFYLLFQKADILYSADSDTLPGCTLVSIVRRKKLIYDAHEYFEQSPEIVHKPFVQFVWRWVTRIGVGRAELCITVSDSLAVELASRYHKNFHTIRNLPIRKPDCTGSKNKKRIWYQGVLNVGRGLEEMIRLMPQLPDHHLVLAGEGDLSNYLRVLVRDLNLEDRVWFLGWLSSDKLHEEACRAWVGINLLSDDNQNYLNSLANKSFDYVQACLPALHMDFPEYRKLVNQFDCALLVENLAAETLLSTFKELDDSERYIRMQDACKLAKSIWCWEQESKKLTDLIQTLNEH